MKTRHTLDGIRMADGGGGGGTSASMAGYGNVKRPSGNGSTASMGSGAYGGFRGTKRR